jgi:hypothetical protein
MADRFGYGDRVTMPSTCFRLLATTLPIVGADRPTTHSAHTV